MDFKVSKIYLSAEPGNGNNINPKDDNTDVIVFFENGKKYIASFFAYDNIKVMQGQHQRDGKFHNGEYFWDKKMVLVKDCTINTIEPIIIDLIDEGDFQEAFREL